MCIAVGKAGVILEELMPTYKHLVPQLRFEPKNSKI
jgi:hypothetical protein